jgi:hypothetical protein
VTRSTEGLLALNALLLLSGIGLVWALRGWRDWGDFLASLGLSYVSGVAFVCVAATLVLVAGGGLSTAVVLVLTLGTAAGGAIAGVVLRRPFPRVSGMRLPQGPEELAATALALLTLVLVLDFARAARLQPLVAWDAWAFWVPKAKAIFFFGGLDQQLFRTLPGPSYPLLVPALDAMDFRLMGSADTTALAMQYWFLLVGFVGAAAVLLRGLVSQTVLWLFLALVVVVPEVDHRLLQLIGDWPLDFFFVLAAVSLVRWLRTGERWLLLAYTLFLAATMATKREGQLLAACLVVGALVATVPRRRQVWVPVVGLAAAAFAVNLPWRIWWMTKHLTPDTPPGSSLSEQASRVLPSLGLVLHLLFEYRLWLLAVPIALAAALLGIAGRHLETQVLYLVTGVLAVVGFAWVVWSDPTIPISTRPALTPVPRAVGAITLLSLVLAPLLIADALRPRGARVARDAVPVPEPL